MRGLIIGSWRFRPALVPTVAAVAMLGLLVGLGRWQWGRAEEKDALHREFSVRSADQPMRLAFSPGRSFPANEASRASLRYARVRVGGIFDAERQFLLDNRVHRGVAGYHVLTPLRLDDGASAILVNRGWVPVGRSRAKLPEIPVPDVQATVGGLLLPPGQGGLLLGPSGYDSGGWPLVVQRVELDRMQTRLDLVLYPLVLHLDPESANGFVREWRPYHGISPDRHRAYAFQWWSLAVALVVIYLVVNLSRRRHA